MAPLMQVDTYFNWRSVDGGKRLLDRGLMDTMPNRLIRFWHTFLCWNFAVNLLALIVYGHPGYPTTTTESPRGAEALCVISMICSTFH